MAIHSLQRGQLTRPAPASLQPTSLPAPTRGMNARQNLAEPQPLECVYSFNMEPAEYGMRVRDGYRTYVEGIDNGNSQGVRTIIPYTGDEYADKLFCANNEGIWDCTIDGGTPTLKIGFADQTDNAGYGIYTAFTTDAGENLLFYADQANGLYTYTPSTDTWVQTPGITGITISEVYYIVVHKQRIWLAVRNSTVGYYLAPGAIAGAVTPFYFGAKFKHGGSIVALLNWTVDGGNGLDDYLVVVSRAGDVIPYTGDDPSLITWQAVGTYFVGQIPTGNKIGSDFGGDLIILSEFGVTAMSDLLNASDARAMAANSVSFKIASLLRSDLVQLRDYQGWELRYAPTQGYLIVATPKRAGFPNLQYVLIRTTEGWCFWRSVPMQCVDTWQGVTVIGTANDTIEAMDIAVDGADNAGENGTPINFSLLTNFTNGGSPAQFKRGELVRPTFLGSVTPTLRTKILYDFDTSEILPPASAALDGASLWDTGLWDSAIWKSSTQGTPLLRGGFGIGRNLAIALNGYANTALLLVNIDLMWRTGGVL